MSGRKQPQSDLRHWITGAALASSVSILEFNMGISVSELLILLIIAVVIFGTKRLRNVGSDLGGAIKGFRNAIKSSDEEKPSSVAEKTTEGEVITRTHDKD